MTRSEKEISKFISLILRHKPEIIGIKLDEHGWANVNELITGVSKTKPIDFALLVKIVNEDNKQRYAFNDNKTLIRANQGHSIKVDVELKKMTPPEILYHGTGEKYLEAIEKEGLISKSRLYVHLSSDIQTALKVGKRHGKSYVFIIKALKMHNEGYDFYISDNNVWLTKNVPLEFIEKIENK